MSNKREIPPFVPEIDPEVSLELSTIDEIEHRSRIVYEKIFRDHPVKDILDALFDFVLILDVNRQAVFANRSLLRNLGLERAEAVFGRRTGEIFGCVHASEPGGNCGTTPACALCGGRKAVLAGLRGEEAREEYHITRKDGSAVDLAVSSAPLFIEGENFSFFAISDIGDRKRAESLEQVFFHDVLNVSTVIWGLAEFLKEGRTDKYKEIGNKLYIATRRLVDEIQAQRNIIVAEANELEPNMQPVHSLEIVRESVVLFEEYGAFAGQQILIDPSSEDVAFTSDPILLRRVISNLLKNALEASKEKAKKAVEVGCRRAADSIEFRVHNDGCMPHDVQLRMFNRGFSTKSKGRGLGTYSVKLIGERYLKGKVSFESSEEKGTTFYARFPAALFC